MKALTIGSLFSGIGGLDLGLERAGMEIRWQCEIDPFLRRVLAKHWPNIPCYKDVREIDEKAPKVDLICGGFPCQPVSTAGRRKGEEDSRWLWPEFNRVIREVRPRWVLVENVPGLLSIDAGRLFGGVLRDLAEGGYDASWDCIPAVALGAPHIRDRVFVVAYAASQRERSELPARGIKLAGSEPRRDPGERRTALAHPPSLQPRSGQQPAGDHEAGHRGTADVPDAATFGRGRRAYDEGQEAAERSGIAPSSWWAVEPDVGRVAHGIPVRVDRLRGLGNAVVPQVAEYIGRVIVAANA